VRRGVVSFPPGAPGVTGRQDTSAAALLSWPLLFVTASCPIAAGLSVMTLSAALSCWLPLRDRLRFARPSCHLLLLCWLGRSCRRRSRLAARAGAMRLQFLLLAAIVMGAAAAVLAAPAPGVAAGLTGPRPPHQHREVTAGLVGKRAMRRLQSMSRQVCINSRRQAEMEDDMTLIVDVQRGWAPLCTCVHVTCGVFLTPSPSASFVYSLVAAFLIVPSHCADLSPSPALSLISLHRNLYGRLPG